MISSPYHYEYRTYGNSAALPNRGHLAFDDSSTVVLVVANTGGVVEIKTGGVVESLELYLRPLIHSCQVVHSDSAATIDREFDRHCLVTTMLQDRIVPTVDKLAGTHSPNRPNAGPFEIGHCAVARTTSALIGRDSDQGHIPALV